MYSHKEFRNSNNVIGNVSSLYHTATSTSNNRILSYAVIFRFLRSDCLVYDSTVYTPRIISYPPHSTLRVKVRPVRSSITSATTISMLDASQAPNSNSSESQRASVIVNDSLSIRLFSIVTQGMPFSAGNSVSSGNNVS